VVGDLIAVLLPLGRAGYLEAFTPEQLASLARLLAPAPAPQPVRAVGRLSVEGRPLPKSCHWIRNTVPAGAGLGGRC
jgi:hypothetical protein